MTDQRIIGREYEQHLLKDICNEMESDLSQFMDVAVWGRPILSGNSFRISSTFSLQGVSRPR